MSEEESRGLGVRDWFARSWGTTLIGGKLLLPFTVVMGAIPIFVCLYFPSAMEQREEAGLMARGRSVASMAAFNVQAGLVFSDRKEVEDLYFPGEESLPSKRLTISLGLAGVPEDARDLKTFIQRADRALYHAKGKGRNSLVAYGNQETAAAPPAAAWTKVL